MEKELERLNLIVNKLRSVIDVNFQVEPRYYVEGSEFYICVCPDNTIFITVGLVCLLDNDELAGALAHEIAHTESPNRKKHLDFLQKYGYLENSFSGRMIYWFSLVFDRSRMLSVIEFIHAEEFRADARSAQILEFAGFGKTGMTNSLKKILATFGHKRHKDTLIHPSIRARIEALEKLFRSLET